MVKGSTVSLASHKWPDNAGEFVSTLNGVVCLEKDQGVGPAEARLDTLPLRGKEGGYGAIVVSLVVPGRTIVFE